MSLVPETFEYLGTTTQDGHPVVYAGREKFVAGRRVLTVWKLIQRRGNWYNCGQFVSKGHFQITDDPRSPITRPLKLSDSRIDRTLRAICEAA